MQGSRTLIPQKQGYVAGYPSHEMIEHHVENGEEENAARALSLIPVTGIL